MIQVIERVAAILDLVSSEKRSWPMTEIADTLKINRATCANILKTLVELGYLEKNELKKGYSLGYQLYKITGSNDRISSILEFSHPIIDEMAHKINESTILSTIRNDRRILLYQVLCNHEIQVKAKTESTVYRTTTGRLQLAYFGRQKLEDFIKIAGMPGEEWPEASTREKLEEELSAIRKKKLLLTINKNHVVGLAAPLFHNENIVAAIGIYLPDIRFSPEKLKQLESALSEAADKINSML